MDLPPRTLVTRERLGLSVRVWVPGGAPQFPRLPHLPCRRPRSGEDPIPLLVIPNSCRQVCLFVGPPLVKTWFATGKLEHTEVKRLKMRKLLLLLSPEDPHPWP